MLTAFYSISDNFVTGLWEIAADKKRNISHRYLAASKLAKVDPHNARWPEIASDIINDHDWSVPYIFNFAFCFRWVGVYNIDTILKGYFREPILRKINQCTESRCPAELLSELFSVKEASSLIADGYMSGHFSLNAIKANRYFFYTWSVNPQSAGREAAVNFRALFGAESSNALSEKRRQVALLWLKDDPWLSRLPSRN